MGGDGQEVTVSITYEPSALGAATNTLLLTSDKGGEYAVVLKGQCDPPKPQGPILVKSGGSSTVQFKNVLDTPEQFNFALDDPDFQVSKKTENIKNKSVAGISVSYKPSGGGGESKAKGTKLLITCPAVKGATWVYYLRGVS